MIITIDGLSGVGKSTIAKLVSQKLGYNFVSTGRIYRTLALFVRNAKSDLEDEAIILENINELSLSFQNNILIANNIIDEIKLKGEDIAFVAATIGENGTYKKMISEKIINMVKDSNSVVEGRNAGNNLFPYADFKIHLYADTETRTNRKKQQLTDRLGNFDKDLFDFRDNLVASSVSENTYKIDTTHKTITEISNEILEQLSFVLHS